MDRWMDGLMDVLETGPGVGSDALLMQQVVTQVQHSQMDAAPQCLLSHLLNQVVVHLQLLYKREKHRQTGRSDLGHHGGTV